MADAVPAIASPRKKQHHHAHSEQHAVGEQRRKSLEVTAGCGKRDLVTTESLGRARVACAADRVSGPTGK